MDEQPTVATMRMVAVTGFCTSSAAKCEAGDVTMTIAFTRPVTDAPDRYLCPWCGHPLRLFKTTVLRDGYNLRVGSMEGHVGVR